MVQGGPRSRNLWPFASDRWGAADGIAPVSQRLEKFRQRIASQDQTLPSVAETVVPRGRLVWDSAGERESGFVAGGAARVVEVAASRKNSLSVRPVAAWQESPQERRGRVESVGERWARTPAGMAAARNLFVVAALEQIAGLTGSLESRGESEQIRACRNEIVGVRSVGVRSGLESASATASLEPPLGAWAASAQAVTEVSRLRPMGLARGQIARLPVPGPTTGAEPEEII